MGSAAAKLLGAGLAIGLGAIGPGIGLGIFIWIQVAFFRTAYGVLRKAKSSLDIGHWALIIGLMASMVDFLAHGLVDAAYFVVDLAFVFMLTLALIQEGNKEQVDK